MNANLSFFFGLSQVSLRVYINIFSFNEMVNLRNRKRTRESEPSVPENSNRAGSRNKRQNTVRGSPDPNAMANNSSVVMRAPRADNFNENERTVSLVSELSNSSVSLPQSIAGSSIFSTGTLLYVPTLSIFKVKPRSR